LLSGALQKETPNNRKAEILPGEKNFSHHLHTDLSFTDWNYLYPGELAIHYAGK
jgi:hypothetical protein